MRTTYDLRQPDERAALGYALAPLIQGFTPDGQPFGTALDAFDQVLAELHRQAAVALRRSAKAGLLARLGLGGTGRSTLTAEDVARHEGYLAALEAVRDAVVSFGREARDEAERRRGADDDGRDVSRGRASQRPLGTTGVRP